MAFAIGISFPAGRFHATPWGCHVNEGVPEWPPSPWRLIRALVATWKRKLDHEKALGELIPNVIGKLVQPPVFKLPAVTTSHTRHYMPWHKKWNPESPHESKTMVFDTFVAFETGSEIVVSWPEAILDKQETRAIDLLLSEVTYLGRAESWVSMRLTDSPRESELNCVPLNSPTINHNIPNSSESVTVLAPDPETWDAWSYGVKAYKPEPSWNILAETKDLHAEGWCQPPGSREITYIRDSGLQSSLPPMPQYVSRPINVVRYVLDGQVLPLVTETIYLAEIARRYVQGIFGKKFDSASSMILSGKSFDGKPLEGHEHAFFLPTDEDGDMRLDHLTVFSAKGFSLQKELRVLDKFRRMYAPGGIADINLLMVGMGDSRGMSEVPILSQSLGWRSVTPFVPVRHYKKRGQKRDTCDLENFPEIVLREELQRRGFPDPIRVEKLDKCELWDHWKRKRCDSARSLSWLQFRRERVFGNGKRGLNPGCGFEIEFAAPVQGPLALGYGCHFGLGLFAPI